jgi:ATP-dependent Clp protease ATP-binding subunit ClpC
MFEKYTDKARRTIFFARYEVSKLGGQLISPEHLLLGLLREDDSVLPRLLGEQDKPVREAIRQRVVERCRVGEEISTSVEIPLADEMKDLLKYAGEESEGMGQGQIGTEHLLLGLLRVEGSLAAGVLGEQGVEYGAVREALKEMAGE